METERALFPRKQRIGQGEARALRASVPFREPPHAGAVRIRLDVIGQGAYLLRYCSQNSLTVRTHHPMTSGGLRPSFYAGPVYVQVGVITQAEGMARGRTAEKGEGDNA
jgi:hypothetical protein